MHLHFKFTTIFRGSFSDKLMEFSEKSSFTMISSVLRYEIKDMNVEDLRFREDGATWHITNETISYANIIYVVI